MFYACPDQSTNSVQISRQVSTTCFGLFNPYFYKDWRGESINQGNSHEGDGRDCQRIQGGYQTQTCGCEQQHYIETIIKVLLGLLKCLIS